MSESPARVLIELRPSCIDQGGVGVFAVVDLRKGERIADGISEQDFEQLVPWELAETYSSQIRKKINDFCVGTPEGFIPPPDFDFNRLSIEWYLNHSCEGNCGFNGLGDFVAITDIAKDAELAYDYALAESNPQFVMRCTCGSENCRHIITGNDWKDEHLRIRHREHVLPHLRHQIPILA